MIVLSLFDGISTGLVALKNIGINPKAYYASETDSKAIKVAKANHPEIIHIGDVSKVLYRNGILYTENGCFVAPKVDLLIGGSPCQGFSSAGLKRGMDDPRSKLFWEFIRIKEEVKPKHFLLENVVPKKKEWEDAITEAIGVKPVLIDSASISAQTRKRLYWTDLEVSPIAEKNILLCDVVGFRSEVPTVEEAFEELAKHIRRTKGFEVSISRYGTVRPHQTDERKSGIGEVGSLPNPMSKAMTMTASHSPKTYTSNPFRIYELNRRECEMLQTMPLGYTDCVSEKDAKRMLGNGWTAEVISHILKSI